MVHHVPLCRQMANFLVDVIYAAWRALSKKKKEKRKKAVNRITFFLPSPERTHTF